MLVNSKSVKMGYRKPGVIYRSISDGRVKIQTKLRWMIKRDVLHVYYCSLNLTRLLYSRIRSRMYGTYIAISQSSYSLLTLYPDIINALFTCYLHSQ